MAVIESNSQQLNIYNRMKFLVKFSEGILPDIEKELNANESIQNLEILISLNFEKMNESKLVYQGKSLNNKQALLREIFLPDSVNEIVVVPKGELESYAEKLQTGVNIFQQYPFYGAALVVGILFLILFLMGS